MEFTELVKKRYSCRQYRDEKPEREKLLEVIEIARLAPSAKNLQPWKFILVDDESVLEKMRTLYPRDWFTKVPAVIVVCGDFKNGWVRSYDRKMHTDVDVSITIDHLTLAATDMGLATCWVCSFNPKEVRKILQIPKKWEAIALIPIGFPEGDADTERHAKLRKTMDEIVSFNQF